MQSTGKMIFWYHTGFQVCAVCSGLFLFWSILLFFHFDMAKIILDRTGRAMKKSIRRMEKAYDVEQKRDMLPDTCMPDGSIGEPDLVETCAEGLVWGEITGHLPVRFQVTKREILIHTDEVIEGGEICRRSHQKEMSEYQ